MEDTILPTSPFRDKILKLQAATDEGRRKIESKERSVPPMVIAGAIVPFVILLVLIFFQPSIVQRKEGDKTVRDNKKIFYWTVGLTLVIWLAMYMWTRTY